MATTCDVPALEVRSAAVLPGQNGTSRLPTARVHPRAAIRLRFIGVAASHVTTWIATRPSSRTPAVDTGAQQSRAGRGKPEVTGITSGLLYAFAVDWSPDWVKPGLAADGTFSHVGLRRVPSASVASLWPAARRYANVESRNARSHRCNGSEDDADGKKTGELRTREPPRPTVSAPPT
jgi:ribonuclease I